MFPVEAAISLHWLLKTWMVMSSVVKATSVSYQKFYGINPCIVLVKSACQLKIVDRSEKQKNHWTLYWCFWEKELIYYWSFWLAISKKSDVLNCSWHTFVKDADSRLHNFCGCKERQKVLSPAKTDSDKLVMTSFLHCTCYFHMSSCCKKTAFCDSFLWP